MELLKFPTITNHETGEVLAINKMTPKNIKLALQSMTNSEVSEFLTKVNFIKKVSDKLEKTTKEFIKLDKELEFDEDGLAFFCDHRIKQIPMARFNEKKLLEEGTLKEKTFWKKLKAKYTVVSKTIKFG